MFFVLVSDGSLAAGYRCQCSILPSNAFRVQRALCGIDNRPSELLPHANVTLDFSSLASCDLIVSKGTSCRLDNFNWRFFALPRFLSRWCGGLRNSASTSNHLLEFVCSTRSDYSSINNFTLFSLLPLFFIQLSRQNAEDSGTVSSDFLQRDAGWRNTKVTMCLNAHAVLLLKSWLVDMPLAGNW